MTTSSTATRTRSRFSIALKSWALPTFLAFAALATTNHAVAGPFAVTSFNPNNQTVNAGSQASVDLILAVGSSAAYGFEAWIKFDPTVLQVASVTNGNASPFSTVNVNTFNNSLGTIQFKATGGSVANSTVTAASIIFSAIGAGTSAIDIQNINEYLTGYGPYGVNGLAVDGSITVVGNANVPDAAQTVSLFATGLLSLGVLRRRLARG